MSRGIFHPVHLTRKERHCLKMVFFCTVWNKKYLIMKWETRCYTPSFSFVYGPAFTYLRIISHHCNASERNFKENLSIQDILIHQKSSNLENSLLLAYATCVEVSEKYGVITKMILLAMVKFFWMIDISNCEWLLLVGRKQ